MTRTLFAGADLVLPDRVASGCTLVVEGSRIVDVIDGHRGGGPGDRVHDVHGHVIVPGFIDVHVHGAFGTDVLDGPSSTASVAARLVQRGVTAFCPTSIACDPRALETFLADVSHARTQRDPGSARVLPAHLESNFINPEYRGAQPLACLRTGAGSSVSADTFRAADILQVIDRHRPDVGIITLAPELPGGAELVRRLVAAGIRVSLGHSGATFEEAEDAIALGARHATHLFNRMRPMTQRDPGLVGAILASEAIAAELICDGRHVHPAVVHVAVAAKGASRVMAITDGTAGSGLPAGATARLGGQTIHVSDVARLDDGTMAGSVLTMDRAFATLVTACGLDLVQAATLTSTTPARELALDGFGVISPGAVADLTLLNSRLDVVGTWIAGQQVWGPRTVNSEQ
jgi:N-acetylglucosamine-6-phosphate deacetylase